jgi:hypothetical protein
MLKRIPKSDISIRPFKAYKEWSFDNTSLEIDILEANVSSSVLSGLYPKNTIYGQLRAQFYYDSGDNPILRSGHKSNVYNVDSITKERFLDESAKIVSIPIAYIGEGIQKGSLIFIDDVNLETEEIYTDDSFGNLQNVSGSRVGNVFYNQGLIVFTRGLENLLQSQWQFNYKSTKTIYENEYLIVVSEDEFNVSQNPSAIVEVGKVDEYITTTDNKISKTTPIAGIKYIKKLSTLDNGNVLDYRYSGSVGTIRAGFEHYDLSGSVDSTGSFLAPYITTIGLYDDNADLVAVAKLPQPIKSEPQIPVNFIIRFDT